MYSQVVRSVRSLDQSLNTNLHGAHRAISHVVHSVPTYSCLKRYILSRDPFSRVKPRWKKGGQRRYWLSGKSCRSEVCKIEIHDLGIVGDEKLPSAQPSREGKEGARKKDTIILPTPTYLNIGSNAVQVRTEGHRSLGNWWRWRWAMLYKCHVLLTGV